MDSTASILLVEDEELIVDIFTRTLKNAGFRVTAARTGRRARAMVMDASFDLAIVDMSLPDTDGPALVAELKSICPSLKVIATSGFMGGIRHLALWSGAIDALQKPVSPAALRAAASDALAEGWMPSNCQTEVVSFTTN